MKIPQNMFLEKEPLVYCLSHDRYERVPTPCEVVHNLYRLRRKHSYSLKKKNR